MRIINNYTHTDGFNYLEMLYCALGIVVCVLLVWYVWGAYVYRYSSDRIENILIKKYDGPLGEDQIVLAENGLVSPDKKMITALITVRNRQLTQSVQKWYRKPVLENCSPLDKSCVSL